MPGPSEAVWPAVDRCTQSANSTANHGTRHGSGFIRDVVTRTIAVATPDTITVTATSTITYPETQPDGFSVSFTVPDPAGLPTSSGDLMRRVVARVGLPATVVGITAVLIIAASSLILAVGYRNQLGALRHTLYAGCQQREAYDRASQDTRGALRAWFATNAGQEAVNPFIGRQLRRQRVTADQRVVRKLDHVLHVGAPTGCQQYR